MKGFISPQKIVKILSLAVLSTFVIFPSTGVFAKYCKKHHRASPIATYKGEAPMPMAPISTFVPSWYVGGHIGVSRTHDKATAGSGNSVTQIGPGWTVDLGYQFAQFYRATLAGELGYTQYHNSNETAPLLNVATTEHFSTYLAAVAQYPLVYNFNILGKLGIAYSYAKKVFTGGASASANTYSPYYGAGISYNVTSNAALILQWARARGNSSTGSTDLTSLGVTYNLV